MKVWVSSLFLVLFLVSCGKDPKIVNSEASNSNEAISSKEAVIVGNLDWRDISKATQKEKEASSPVGLLKIPQISSRCTAFMITDDIVMTNNHCVEDAYGARGVTITFNYTSRKSNKKTYKCDKFLHTNKRLDYTLLECKNKPGAKVGNVVFTNRTNFSKGEQILVIHNNCDYFNDYYCNPYLKFSTGKILSSNSNSGKVFYDADTLGGSSGSPVFYQSPKNQKYYLVALHNMGYGGNDNGRGDYNSGVQASKLIVDINSYLKTRD